MTPQFQEAVAAIDRGDVTELDRLLAAHPELLRERGEHPEAYFRRPFLLWFVAENPVRNGRLPANIGEVVRTIVEAARRGRVDTLPRQLDYTLSLVSSGRVPRESGVQAQLIDVLVDAGADPTEALEPALAHRELAAVEHLFRRGAKPTLTAAACRGDVSAIERLAPDAGRHELQAALIGAALYGWPQAVAPLLRHGADVNGYGPDSFHPHATALHQAVYTGSLDTVKALVEAGASLALKDGIHEGTPLGWAEHMKREEIAAYLRERELHALRVGLGPRG
jgi:ankyrin repeat protein